MEKMFVNVVCKQKINDSGVTIKDIQQELSRSLVDANNNLKDVSILDLQYIDALARSLSSKSKAQKSLQLIKESEKFLSLKDSSLYKAKLESFNEKDFFFQVPIANFNFHCPPVDISEEEIEIEKHKIKKFYFNSRSKHQDLYKVCGNILYIKETNDNILREILSFSNHKNTRNGTHVHINEIIIRECGEWVLVYNHSSNIFIVYKIVDYKNGKEEIEKVLSEGCYNTFKVSNSVLDTLKVANKRLDILSK